MHLGLDKIKISLKSSLDYNIYAGIILLSILIYLISPSWLNRASLSHIQEDKMFSQHQPTSPSSKDVIIVAIDDSSLINLGKWPWDREILAQLIWTINLAEPKVIGLNLSFPKDVTQDTSGNTELLAEIIKETGSVVLPVYFSFSEVGVELPSTPSFITKSAIQLPANQTIELKLPTGAKRVDYPDPKLAESAIRLGHVNLFYGKGHKIREEKLFLQHQGKLYPSFALQVAEKYIGAKTNIEDGKKLFLENCQIPIDDKGNFRINYSGPNGTFKHLSAWDVLNDKVNAADLYNKAVLVGSINTITSNKVPTPVSSEKMYEVERIANVVENLIHKNFLTNMKLPNLGNILIILIIGLFCSVSFPRVTLVYRFAVVGVIMLIVIYLDFILLPSLGLLSQPVYHTLELILFAILAPVIEYIKPSSQKMEEEEFEPEEQEEYISQEDMYSAPVRVVKEEAITNTAKVETRIPEREEKPIEESSPKSSSSQLMAERVTKSSTSSLKKSTAHLGIKQFGRYEILGLLGKGAMGTVYKGKDPAIDRLVALKTIRMDFSEDEEEINELRERLMREAQAAGKMSHPNIVTIYDVGQEEDFQYIAMEYLEGYTLESYLRKKGELNYKIVAKTVMQVCEALSYAHSKGIVHRDIKPANIMILDNFEVKVMDFGIARFGVSSMTQAGTAMGTPHYISPEQLEGKTADRRSDIFSLGVILYEFLTRQKPFKGDNISALAYSIINDNPLSPSSINDKTPPIFDRIVAKAMTKEPNERYQNAEEITKTLKEFIVSFVVNRSVKL